MLFSLYELIFDLSLVARFIPLVMILTYYRQQPLTYRWLAALIFLSFGCDVAAEILYRFNLHVNIASNLYSIVDPVITSIFFYYVIGWKSLRTSLVVFNILFLLFSVSNLVLIQQTNMNTYTSIGDKMLTLVLCILYFYKQIREMTSVRIESSGMFWIVTSMFITHSAQLVLFTFVEYLIHVVKDNMILPWIIHNLLMMIRNLVIIYGVWLHNRTLGNVQRTH